MASTVPVARAARRRAFAAAALVALLSTSLAVDETTAQVGRRGPQRRVEEPPPKIPPLGQGATGTLVHNYEEADHWAMKAILLMSFGTDWHPDGVSAVVDALGHRDDRLPPYAVETLLRADDRVVRSLARPELIEELIDESRNKNEYYRERVLAVLKRLAPDANCDDNRSYKRWWRDEKETWAPPAWTEAEVEHGEGTVTARLVERAFDLRDAGLQVVFVLDTTGSMQVAIDASRDAVDDITALLAGITPKLELGLVHYKDFGDFSEGAKMLVPLTRKHDKVRDKLGKLTAIGGGDAPERIEKGVEVALGRKMKWDKDANRMLLIIGDAPAHHDAEDELLALVKRAHDHPFSTGKGPVTGGRSELRPFITSAIATNPIVLQRFEAIAEAGGGTAVGLNLAGRGPLGGMPMGDDRERRREGAARKRNPAAEKIAEHVLLLSFGAGYEAQLREFVKVFFAYRRAGLFD